MVLVLLLVLAAALGGAWALGRALGWWSPGPGQAGASAPVGVAGPMSPPQAGTRLRTLGLTEWLAGHSQAWRVARLKEYPEVLVIEFPDLQEQGAAMNRLAAFLQKAGAPRDRVLNDTELAAFIARGGDTTQTFYQGHDYDDVGLARFFAQVRAQGLVLNAQELRVLSELQAAGVMLAAAPATAPTNAPQAVITFTATQPDDTRTAGDESVDALRREAVLRHEVSHGRFYTRANYREHCLRFWRDVLSEAQREAVRRFLVGLAYNREDELLMVNEAQAFMMNTPDPRAFAASDIGMGDAELAALRLQFWRSLPPDADAVPGAPAAFASRPAGFGGR